MDLGSIWDAFGTFWRLWSALEGLLRRPERLWRPFGEVFWPQKRFLMLKRIFSEICNYFLHIFRIFSVFVGMKFRSSHLLSYKLQSPKSLHIFKLTCTAHGFLAERCIFKIIRLFKKNLWKILKKKLGQIQKPSLAPFWRGFGLHFGPIWGSKSLPKRTCDAQRGEEVRKSA